MGGKGSGRKQQTHHKCGLPYNYRHANGKGVCTSCSGTKKRTVQKGIREIVYEYKLSMVKCKNCEIAIHPGNVAMFALDHREPKLKRFNLSKAQRYPREIILEECLKCDLLCHNCHAMKTYYSSDHKNQRIRRKVTTTAPLLLMMEDAS
jgi:ribosomal protein L24